jgi:RNA polymerase sigma-70 factor (family 1)
MPALSTLTDQELVSLLRESDHAAYTEIYERYFGLMYSHARRKIRDVEEARDTVQETFLSLWHHREKIDGLRGVAPYLYTILKNRIIDWMAHQEVSSKYITSFHDFTETGNCITDHRIRESQLMAIIEKEIQSLPPRMREVFELSRKTHLSHRQIAEVLDISEQTVKSQVKHALRILRRRLGLLLYLFVLLNL